MAEREILTLKRKQAEPVVEVTSTAVFANVTVIKSTKSQAIELEIIQQLIETYPQTFFAEQRKPLMVGIFAQLVEALSPLSKTRLRNAMRMYCVSAKYFESIINETHRIDLTGQPVTEISAEDKIHAEKKLEKRFDRKIDQGGKKMSKSEKKVANAVFLANSFSLRRSDRKINQDGCSVWTFSGGLPSLGKRN
jgi:sRNA-binding protein